jgi:hypothetical protein
MAESGSAEFRQRYERLLKAVASGEHADRVAEAKTVTIPGTARPWTETGIELDRNDQLTVLAGGRLVLSDELDVWFPPRLYLWRRIGEKGPIFKAARDTATHRTATSGRLYLAVNPGHWTTPAGDYEGAEAEFIGAPGGYDALLIRWRADAEASGGVAEGLRALQRHAPNDALIAAEIERLQSTPVVRPAGWEYLWFLGESDMFSGQETDAGEVIRARPENDAAILKKSVALDLTPETRLRWRWKFDQLPARVAEDQLHTHDYISIAVEFENGQDLTYYWSAALPAEQAFRCPLPWWDLRETHMVIRSGPEGLGQWFAEERNVHADYRAAVGEPPARIVGVWLIAVSVFSHSLGAADFADIEILNGDERQRVH